MMISGSHRSENVNKILIKHKEAIQNYMMTGYENKWQYCDRLSDNSHYSDNEPQITMNLEEMQTVNLKAAFAYSTCLLVHYDVSSKATLSALFEFGWKAINHVRLAMVITMRSGITLEMANNTSNLPFLVAAQLDDGKEQFLCPVVGEIKPHFGLSMCTQSFINYKNKKIRYGMVGVPPHLAVPENFGNGKIAIDGTAPSLMKMLAEKLSFNPIFVWTNSYNAVFNKVYHLCEESKPCILIKTIPFRPAIEKLTYPCQNIYTTQDFTSKMTLLVLLGPLTSTSYLVLHQRDRTI